MDTNIQVGIRVRPLIEREIQAHQKLIWKTDDNRIYNHDKGDYQFDKVFGKNVSTSMVYNEMGKPLVEKAMEGFNGTLFAYGQTASGKTHTIMGDATEPGIVPLAVQDVFNHINEQPDREFLLRASYIEIYNEEITDLVGNKKGIKVRNNCDNEIVIDNLTEQTIISYEEAMELINKGIRHRKIGTTNMNERSSRSHVIFRLVMESRQLPDELNMSECDGAVIVSQLNLVDLAGSERAAQTGAQGIRLKESAFINTSLMTLGVVIRKLSENDGHVPYRDSKLTRILQNSLGGNARTSIICTVSPVVFEETDQTLKFAGRAKNVKNKPKINEVLDGDTMLRRQMNEIRNLKKKIQELEGGAMHAEMIMEKDMMLAEQKTYRQKIDEQQSRISKLLKEIVCSGPGRRKAIVGSKTSRRQTWCPGGLTQLRSLSETELNQKAKSLNPNRTISKISENPDNSVVGEQLRDISIDTDLDSTQAFEKLEYGLLQKEFDEYRANTCTPEEYKKLKSSLVQAEMESEAFKNKMRDLQTECERLRSQLQNSDAMEWQSAMELTLEQKCVENAELSNVNKNLVSEKATLEEKANELSTQLKDTKERLTDLNEKYNALSEEQTKMVSLEYLEQLKEEVLAKSLELEEDNKKCQLENEELKSAREADKKLHQEQMSSLQEENTCLKQELTDKESMGTELLQLRSKLNELTEQASGEISEDVQKTIDNIKEQLEIMRKDKEEIDAKYKSLEENHSVKMKELYDMVGADDFSSLKDIVDKSQTEKLEMETRIRDIQEKMASHESEKSELKVRIEESNSLIINNEADKNALKVEVEELKLTLEEKNNILSDHETKIKENELTILKYENENKELEYELTKQTTILAEYESKLKEFQTLLEQKEEELRNSVEQGSDRDQLSGRIDELTSALTVKENELIEMKDNFLKRDESYASLELQLQELTAKLSTTEDSVQHKEMESHDEQFQAELEEYKAKYENVLEEQSVLEEKLQHLEAMPACRIDEHFNLSEKLATHENLVVQLQSEIAHLSIKLQEMNDISNERKHFKNENSETSQTEERMSEDIEVKVEETFESEHKEEENSEMQVTIHEAQQLDEILMNEFQNDISNFQTREDKISQIQQRIREMKEENSKYQEEHLELNEVVTEAHKLKKELESQNVVIAELKEELENAQTSNEFELTVTKLQEEIIQLQQTNEELRQEIDEYMQQINTHVQEISTLKEAITKHENEVELLIIEKSSIEELVKSLSEEKLNMTEEIDGFKEEIVELKKRLDEFSSCNEDFNSEKQQLTDQIASLNLQIASLQEQAEDGESKEKQLAELQISLETYMSEKKSLESDIETLKDVIESQGEEGQVLQSAFEKKCEAHLELSNKHDELQKQIDALMSDNEKLKTLAENLQTEKESNESRCQELLDEKTQHVSQMQQLEQSRIDLKSEVGTLQDELANLHRENDSLLKHEDVTRAYKEQLETKGVKLSEVELELVNLQQQFRDCENELAEKCEVIVQLEKENREFQTICDEQKHLKSSAEENLQSIEALLAKKVEETEEYETKYTTSCEEVKKLSEKVLAKQNEIYGLVNTVDNMKCEIEQLQQQLEEEKKSCNEEKNLAKKAYERRSDQTEAHSLELMSSLKKLQAVNATIEEERGVLLQKLDELEQNIKDDRNDSEEKQVRYGEQIASLEEEVKELNEKLISLSDVEKEKQQIECAVDELTKEKSELEESLRKSNDEVKRLQECDGDAVLSVTTEINKSSEHLLEKLKRLEYRLQLRKEDIGVYADRVSEQDEEITKLKAKNDCYTAEMKRLKSSIKNIRRPSGQADLQEWEEMVSALEGAKFKLEKENELLQEQYTRKTKENNLLQQNLNNAAKRIPQLEKALKESNPQYNKAFASKENEVQMLKEKATKQEAEIERITNGLKTAFNRMTTAETTLATKQNEFQCEIKKRDVEINRVTDGLTTAFERYKHYKELAHSHGKEIEFLKSKISDVEGSILSSMKENSRTEIMTADILKKEIGERKRKSESPHEGSSSTKYKVNLEPSKSQDENECKQQ